MDDRDHPVTVEARSSIGSNLQVGREWSFFRVLGLILCISGGCDELFGLPEGVSGKLFFGFWEGVDGNVLSISVWRLGFRIASD